MAHWDWPIWPWSCLACATPIVCIPRAKQRTCFMSGPVIAVIWEPNIEGRVTCDARDLIDVPERAERTLPRENADPAVDALRPLPSGTDLRGSEHRMLLFSTMLMH